MWWHLSGPRLMELLEGAADPKGRAHVEECERCRQAFESAREGLSLARTAEAPEPVPMYWQALRENVDRRVGSSDSAGRHLRWRPALLAATVLIGALTLGPVSNPGGDRGSWLPAWTALPPSEEDPGLAVLTALSPEPEELAAMAGCHRLFECLAGLSEEESQALADVLRQELPRRDL